MPNQPGSVGARGPLRPQKFFTPPQSEAPPFTLDDGSDSWWVGAQQAIVGVVATAALALTVGVAVQTPGYQDELPQIVDEVYALQQVVQPQLPPLPPITEDPVIVPQPAVFTPDEEPWLSQFVPPGYVVAYPFQSEEVIVAQAATIVDEDLGPTPFAVSAPPVLQPFFHQDELPFIYVSDDDIGMPVPLVPAPVYFWQTYQQDELAFIYVSDDDVGMQVPLAPGLVVFGQTYQQDELAQLVDEVYWQQPPIALVVLPQQGNFDTPEIGTATIGFDEEPGFSPYPTSAAQVSVQALSDHQELAGIGIDENPAASAFVVAQAANVQPWFYDADAVFPAAATMVDEDFWFNPALPVWPTAAQIVPFMETPELPSTPVVSSIIPTLVYLGGGDDSTVTSGTSINVGGIG